MSQNRTIMVVDDDDDTREMLKIILHSQGFNVVDCSGGQQALDLMKETTPALVILDIMMPEMNGYEVLVRMKQNPKTQNVDIIFLTAKGELDDILTGYKEYEVDYYITKPFTARQLLAGIKLVLGYV